MVKVAVIDGIKIYLYNDEHPPPHFHAVYAEHEAMIDIETLEITRGYLPAAHYRKVRRWAETRRADIMRVWTHCRIGVTSGKIT